MIIQLDNAFSDADCRCLIELYEQNAHSSKEQYEHLLKDGDHTENPILFWDQIEDLPDAIGTVPRVISECSRRVVESFGLTDCLYPETVIITKFGPGAYHPLHADNSRQDKRGKWVPNHSPRRDISAICYLNEDFEGGELAFQKPPLTIKPRTRLLVAFPGDAKHVHEVFPVRTGWRYAMPIWFTKQREFGLQKLSRLTNATA